jgi:hypothetical protein
MRTRILAAAGYTLSAFSVLASAVQVLVLSPRLRLLTFGLTLVFAFCAYIFFRGARAHHNALAALKTIWAVTPADKRFEVRTVSDEAQLRELWEIDTESYGPASITFDTFSEWWKCYPTGLFALFEGEEIVGGFGIWPLSTKAFRDFVEGRIRERELGSRHIVSLKQRSRTSWYISGIVLKTRRRKTKAIRELISNALKRWLSDLPTLAASISVCALAYSKDGEALLRRFGFHCYRHANETIDHYPVFARFNLSATELKHMCGRLLPHMTVSHIEPLPKTSRSHTGRSVGIGAGS